MKIIAVKYNYLHRTFAPIKSLLSPPPSQTVDPEALKMDQPRFAGRERSLLHFVINPAQ